MITPKALLTQSKSVFSETSKGRLSTNLRHTHTHTLSNCPLTDDTAQTFTSPNLNIFLVGTQAQSHTRGLFILSNVLIIQPLQVFTQSEKHVRVREPLNEQQLFYNSRMLSKRMESIHKSTRRREMMGTKKAQPH